MLFENLWLVTAITQLIKNIYPSLYRVGYYGNRTIVIKSHHVTSEGPLTLIATAEALLALSEINEPTFKSNGLLKCRHSDIIARS